MWLNRWTALQFVYEGNRHPRINLPWVELLAAECWFTGTLVLPPEPVEAISEVKVGAI